MTLLVATVLATMLAVLVVPSVTARLWRQRPPQRIEDAAPILPHDHPIACLGCGRVHKGPCMNAALWEEDL